jgi:uncharacterized protein (TIGR00251 family)
LGLAQIFRVTATGLTLHLRVTPNAGTDRIEGIEERDDGTSVIRVRVKAVPDNGRANAAVLALIAEALGIPKSHVRLVAGEASRLKTVAVEGNPGALTSRLETLLQKSV